MAKFLIWFFIIVWIIQGFFAIASGCPPMPFTHRCLMRQAGVIPPFINSYDN